MKHKMIWSLVGLSLTAVLLFSYDKLFTAKREQYNSVESSESPPSADSPKATATVQLSTNGTDVDARNADNKPAMSEEQGVIRDLESKLANEKKLQAELLSEVASQKSAMSAEQMVNLQQATMEIVGFAKNGRWDDFIASFESLEQHGPEILDLSLYQAVLFEAPWSVIDTLINNGANINDSVALLLATKSNRERFKKLVDKGLNLHATDHLGKNALDYFINGTGNKLRFVKYLLENNVSLSPDQVVRDPLDSALEGYSKGSASVAIISMLVNHGAPVEESHRQTLTKLYHTSPEKYWLLAQNVPELALPDTEQSS